ncbi:MAG: hypothetical protein COW88_02340 [Candidatus Lloydbacteria bacterium CG22_combo_CG10-13_8_21_14_all_47_15]|uniref:PABS domain-containing protein n=1 Tax=Candidatus Lloydbacteria bacterium CG22_combo_CG10-13_8_21_14_all_47_15 TaxID=1974635 RepID=A0A2H0CTT4_9BACT|nr:MAG: hypothetical protein COW88_02340 [Candidatus Lloydbacteria bacterium CG22_combo_CG10-13_8_21_14_all_47_15]
MINWKRHKTYMLYGIVFFTTMSLLMSEIAVIRAAKIAFGFSYEFFLIPLAMMGIGFGGIFVFYFSPLFNFGKKHSYVAGMFFLYAAVTPTPFLFTKFYTVLPGISAEVFFFATSTFVFFIAGVLLSYVFKLHSHQAPALYFFDLFGAALGVFAVVYLMDLRGFSAAVIVAFFVSIVPGIIYSFHVRAHRMGVCFLSGIFVLVPVFYLMPFYNIFSIPCEGEYSLATQSNSFSQVDAVFFPDKFNTEYGNASFNTIPESVKAYKFGVDCFSIGTYLYNFDSIEEMSFLKEGLRSIPFESSNEKISSVLVIGGGGGSDVIRALLHGSEEIIVTEINPLMVQFARNFTTPTSYPYGQPGVRLHVGDTRQFVETTSRKYDLVLYAMSRRFGNLGFLTEYPSYVDTVEAYSTYLRQLQPNGMLVSVFPHRAQEKYTGLVISAFEKNDIDPRNKLVLIEGSRGLEDLIIAKTENILSEELQKIREESMSRDFESVTMYEGNNLARFVNVPTDDRPYLTRPIGNRASLNLNPDTLPLYFLLPTLLIFLVVAATFFRARISANTLTRLGSLVYFSFLGVVSVSFQIASVMKFPFFLGNPTHTLGVVLTSILIFGSLGSISTLRLRTSNFFRTVAIINAIIVALFLALIPVQQFILESLLSAGLTQRLILVIVLIAPLSFTMGMLFPFGLKTIGKISEDLVPWMWGLNGLAAVLGGIIAQIISIHYGYTVLVLSVALSYGAVVLGAFLLTSLPKN